MVTHVCMHRLAHTAIYSFSSTLSFGYWFISEHPMHCTGTYKYKWNIKNKLKIYLIEYWFNL